MVAHAKEQRKIDKIDSSLVVDLEVPQLRVRALCPDPDAPSPIIDVTVRHLTARVSTSSHENHQYTDLAVWARKTELLLCTPNPALRLQDVDPAGVPGLPVGHMVCEGLEVGLDSRSRHKQVTVRLNIFNTGIVTPAFNSIRDIVQVWQAACANIPRSSDDVKPVAIVICDAIGAAVAVGKTASQPMWMNANLYALQTKDPTNLRLTLGWPLLARLRYWMQTLPKPPVDPQVDMASYAIVELAKIVQREQSRPKKAKIKRINGEDEDDMEEEELDEIEVEVQEPTSDSLNYVREQTFMKLAFGLENLPEPSDHTTLLDHTIHVFANIDLFHLEHQGKMLESDQIVSSYLNIVSASTGLQYLTGYKKSRPIKRLRGINTVKAIDLVLQNSIFTAIEPLLSLVPAPELVDEVEGDGVDTKSIIVMDNQIERAELQVVAAGLRMKGILDRGSLNFYRNAEGEVVDGAAQVASQTTATMMISSMETILSVITERVHAASKMPAGIVATWETKDLGGMASHTVFKDESLAYNLKLLLSLRRFDLDIRPQMKALHGLINHVRQEDLP
jgi:hypothetical protein